MHSADGTRLEYCDYGRGSAPNSGRTEHQYAPTDVEVHVMGVPEKLLQNVGVVRVEGRHLLPGTLVEDELKRPRLRRQAPGPTS